MLNFVFLVCRFTRLVAFTMETAISSMSRNAEQSVVLLFDASKQLFSPIYFFDPRNLPSLILIISYKKKKTFQARGWGLY